MPRTLSIALLSALVAPACTDPIDEGGGVGEASLVPESGLITELTGASSDRPCGGHTAANVALPNGNRLALCVLDGGREVFVEQGPIETAPSVDPALAAPACGLDLYLAHTTAETPVPESLVAACAPEKRAPSLATRQIVTSQVIQPFRPASNFTAYNCSAAASTFASLCLQCQPYDDCADWCVTARWGWHDRIMSGSAFLGEEGNVAIERNASCGGPTRVRAWEREDVGDSWGTPKVDFWLPSGQRSTTGIIHHSAVIFGQDYDFRLRADSAAGASHQHSGYFLDE